MREMGDYPGVSKAHLSVSRNYTSLVLSGPPLCDELVALVEHMFTEEEAEVAKHLKPLRFRTSAGLVAASCLPPEHVKDILQRLVHEKHVVFSFGKGDKERYYILPIAPGTFELVLLRTSTDSVTPWHQRFSTLFEDLFATGYSTDYLKKPVDVVRYLPVGEVIQSQPQALPSDRLEVVLDRYSDFAVGVCQCRLSKQLNGEGCGRMLETCTAVGDWAPALVRRGQMRTASKKDVLEIKAAAEKEGLVTWMLNEESGKYSSALCSCCGCCCGALRTITDFNSPGLIAPPHFMPRIEQGSCVYCEKCVKVCPMGALLILEQDESKRLIHKRERCIGCGLCTIACAEGALILQEVPDYRNPPSGWPAHLARYTPNFLSNFWKVWSSRRRSR